MSSPHLIQRDNSLLLIIDVQERLLPAIDNYSAVVEAHRWLLSVAVELNVACLVTEQYPQGIGHTAQALQPYLDKVPVAEKTHFSAMQEPACREAIAARQKKQLVIIGTEAHVCVLQTALDAIVSDYQVFVVADAVGSRHPDDKALALQRMEQAGCTIVSREMVAFEWLGRSATDEFRHISKTYLRQPRH